MDLLDYLSKHCEQLYQQQGLLAQQQKQQQLPPKTTQNQKPSTSALHNKQHKMSVGNAGKNVKTAKVFYVFLN